MKRANFLAAASATPLLLGAEFRGNPSLDASGRTASALVLSGGGARGAYEAGLVEAMRAATQTADGAPLPGVDVVCGASIGALNGWFVATAQFANLKALWQNVASEHIFELKHRYAATTNPRAFIITKIIQAISLAEGLTKNVQGIFDGDAIARWIDKHVEVATPLVTPFVFTVTNLDRARAEVFYRAPAAVPADVRAAAIERLKRTVGASVVVREATDDTIKTAMRASTAIPVLFDPIVMRSPEGTMDRYVDGGIADNNPIDVARALARSVYTILLDPLAQVRQPYDNAFEIVVGAFGVAQARILEASLTATYLETRAKRLFDAVSLSDERRQYLESVLDADLFVIRPPQTLAAGVVDFDRQEKVDATVVCGGEDFRRGWAPFTTNAPVSAPAMR